MDVLEDSQGHWHCEWQEAWWYVDVYICILLCSDSREAVCRRCRFPCFIFQYHQCLGQNCGRDAYPITLMVSQPGCLSQRHPRLRNKGRDWWGESRALWHSVALFFSNFSYLKISITLLLGEAGKRKQMHFFSLQRKYYVIVICLFLSRSDISDIAYIVCQI